MNKGEQHRMAVDIMLEYLTVRVDQDPSGDDFDGMLRQLLSRFPDMSMREMRKAAADAGGIMQERAEVHIAEAELVRARYLPLFDDMPPSTSLIEAAEHKARCGDPLGISVFEELGGAL